MCSFYPFFICRINKAGSSSLLRLAEDLGYQNGFVVVWRGLPKLRSVHPKDQVLATEPFLRADIFLDFSVGSAS